MQEKTKIRGIMGVIHLLNMYMFSCLLSVSTGGVRAHVECGGSFGNLIDLVLKSYRVDVQSGESSGICICFSF